MSSKIKRDAFFSFTFQVRNRFFGLGCRAPFKCANFQTRPTNLLIFKNLNFDKEIKLLVVCLKLRQERFSIKQVIENLPANINSFNNKNSDSARN